MKTIFRLLAVTSFALFCCALASLPARADNISGFNVNGTFQDTGAALSGVLTIDTTNGSVLDAALNLSAGSKGCMFLACSAETFDSIFSQLGSWGLLLQNPSQSAYLGLGFPSTSFTNYHGGSVDGIVVDLVDKKGALMLGGDVSLSSAPVPEPETVLLLLGGLGVLGIKARKRFSRSTAI